MISNALITTIAIMLALGFWLTGELKFLIPYKSVLIHQYGSVILISIVIVFANIFGAAYTIHRKVFLKDTGRKLWHVDKQVVTGHAPVSGPMQDEQLR